ncbi:MAG: hypothetical protein JOZ98_06780 [Solirubrobacterales bacterium]|nr:hypothetical protein [Solirubrobacterales bacterium]MBV9422594.1 hypothetical protein [Solirubrobacterales bacterium]MBV9797447.1 hypothetical protein [Solirubrobacterales bacterium]
MQLDPALLEHFLERLSVFLAQVVILDDLAQLGEIDAATRSRLDVREQLLEQLLQRVFRRTGVSGFVGNG